MYMNPDYLNIEEKREQLREHFRSLIDVTTLGYVRTHLEHPKSPICFAAHINYPLSLQTAAAALTLERMSVIPLRWQNDELAEQIHFDTTTLSDSLACHVIYLPPIYLVKIIDDY